MVYCAICADLFEIAADDVAGWAVHRYFRHGTWAERIVRWGVSAVIAYYTPKIVKAVANNIRTI